MSKIKLYMRPVQILKARIAFDGFGVVESARFLDEDCAFLSELEMDKLERLFQDEILDFIDETAKV